MSKVVIVTGGRDYTDVDKVFNTLDKQDVGVLISGDATGADELGKLWAKERGVTLILVPALWTALGRRAGLKRNHDMILLGKALQEAGLVVRVIGFPGGKGTKHMLDNSLEGGLDIIRIV